MIVWSTLGRTTPVPLNAWRVFLLRCFGASISRGAKIYPTADIWYPANLKMHDFACLGPGVRCYCMAEIELGAYAIASQGAHLCGGTHDIDDPHFQLMTKPIVIGAYAWVAADAFVGPGVTVGEGAVLGARAVTVKDLEPWTVYAGNPARKIRQRMKIT